MKMARHFTDEESPEKRPTMPPETIFASGDAGKNRVAGSQFVKFHLPGGKRTLIVGSRLTLFGVAKFPVSQNQGVTVEA
jgi:hypothetical protein